MRRALVVSVALLSTFSLAQEEWALPPTGGGNSVPPAGPAPAERTPGARPGVVAPRAEGLRPGLQFHGEVLGGTSGLGASVSFGIGLSRVAVLFSPSVLANGTASRFGLDLSVRVYFVPRQQGVLAGYLRPGAGGGFTSASGGPLVAFGSVFLAGGVEYLLTRTLGFSAELGLRVGGAAGTPLALDTVAAFGIVLKQ